MKWKVVKDKSSEHWLEAEGYDGSGVGDLDGSIVQYPVRRSCLKWDGCIHYWDCGDALGEHPGDHTESCQYIHICDIDDFISELRELRATAKKHFGKEWPS